MKPLKILVSACLLGDKVRYDGSDNSYNNEILNQWVDENRIVKICPEVSGGCSIPRPPAEIKGIEGGTGVLKGISKVMTKKGVDVSDLFIQGAKIALELALQENIKIAVLKSRSPSCGCCKIYDGSFTGKLVKGEGVTAYLLRKNGLEVYTEEDIDFVNERLRAMEGL